MPALWFVVPLAFFSCVSGKRGGYLVPIVPAVGLLCARHMREAAQESIELSRWHNGLWRVTWALMAVLAAVLASAALCAPHVAKLLGADAVARQEIGAALTPGRTVTMVVAGVALVVVSFYGIGLPRIARSERRQTRLLVACVVGLSLALDLAAVPVLDRARSGRKLVEQAQGYLDAADEVYLLRSDFGGVFNLFLRRERIPVLEDHGELMAALDSPRRVVAIAWHKHLLAPLDRGRMHLVAPARFGHSDMVLVMNWKPQALDSGDR